MDIDDLALLSMRRAADHLAEAATDLTLAMLAAGDTALGNDASVLAGAVDAELASVAAILFRYRA
jgi:hypothetical protein